MWVSFWVLCSVPWTGVILLLILHFSLTADIENQKSVLIMFLKTLTFPQDMRKWKTLWNSRKNWSWESKDVNLHFYSVKGDP